MQVKIGPQTKAREIQKQFFTEETMDKSLLGWGKEFFKNRLAWGLMVVAIVVTALMSGPVVLPQILATPAAATDGLCRMWLISQNNSSGRVTLGWEILALGAGESARRNWGDGSGWENVGQGSGTWSHTYALGQDYWAELRITNSSGSERCRAQVRIDFPNPTATRTATVTNTVPPPTATNTPTFTPLPTETPTAEPSVTNTPTDSTPVDTPTYTPTAVDTPTEAPTDEPTPVDTPVDTPTVAPTASETPTPAVTPMDTPTDTPTAVDTPTDIPTDVPTVTPEPTVTETPIPEPGCTNGILVEIGAELDGNPLPDLKVRLNYEGGYWEGFTLRDGRRLDEVSPREGWTEVFELSPHTQITGVEWEPAPWWGVELELVDIEVNDEDGELPTSGEQCTHRTIVLHFAVKAVPTATPTTPPPARNPHTVEIKVEDPGCEIWWVSANSTPEGAEIAFYPAQRGLWKEGETELTVKAVAGWPSGESAEDSILVRRLLDCPSAEPSPEPSPRAHLAREIPAGLTTEPTPVCPCEPPPCENCCPPSWWWWIWPLLAAIALALLGFFIYSYHRRTVAYEDLVRHQIRTSSRRDRWGEEYQ